MNELIQVGQLLALGLLVTETGDSPSNDCGVCVCSSALCGEIFVFKVLRHLPRDFASRSVA
jgi:hypothetical protein